MAVKNGGNGIVPLGTLWSAGAIGGLSDGQLLEQFATGRGESRELAFAVLVERYGPFVLSVCRSVLRDGTAAEDAFQATFLALARKAGSLWAQDSLGPWLHQAAYRAASHERSAAIRRRSQEQAAAALRPDSTPPPRHANDGDLERIIHEEIDRLPARFRVSLVLCDLEGRTHDQAARHLGCAVGTIKSRLARGRKKLRERLLRRGVAPAAALAATSAGAGAARAAVPAGLVKLTVLYAATASAAPISISVIAEGVIMSMFVAKVKVAVAATAVVAAFTASAVVLAQSGMGGSKDATGKRDQAQFKIVLTSPELRDVAITQQYVGRVHVPHVNVCTSQKGYLAEIKVSEGQAVKKGDLMFEVRSTLNQAKTDAASTDIVAPFDGIVELPRYQSGSLLRAGEILTTLSNNKKIWVDFNVPEKQYLEYQANPREYDEDKIELVLANGAKFPHPGKLGAIEARFNANTGNITFRAEFPNPDGLLRQGQSGIIELHRTLRHDLVIPRRATFENLGKRYLYIVGKDDTLHRREIVIQYELDDIYVISKGVNAGERIVLDGIRKVHEGEKVRSELDPRKRRYASSRPATSSTRVS